MIAGLPCIIILLLYLAVSANNLATQVNMVRFINSLLDTAIACAGKNGSDLEPYIPILRSSKNARIVMTLQYVVRVVMAVATIAYVLYQAGYLT